MVTAMARIYRVWYTKANGHTCNVRVVGGYNAVKQGQFLAALGYTDVRMVRIA